MSPRILIDAHVARVLAWLDDVIAGLWLVVFVCVAAGMCVGAFG